jgi:DNA-directed RNA polymerase specialized sigma24 family protein
MDDPDIELLRAIVGGDHLAFKRLVERYQSRLFNFLYRYLREREAAEDLTQEVFLKVYQAAPRFEPRAKVRTWIFAIAYNVAVNELRRRQRRGFFGLLAHEERAMEVSKAEAQLELEETMTEALGLLPATREPRSCCECGMSFHTRRSRKFSEFHGPAWNPSCLGAASACGVSCGIRRRVDL